MDLGCLVGGQGLEGYEMKRQESVHFEDEDKKYKREGGGTMLRIKSIVFHEQEYHQAATTKSRLLRHSPADSSDQHY